MEALKPVYLRVLLKVSGEALVGDHSFGVDPEALSHICQDIKEIIDLGVEVAIVIGGGNFVRGKTLAKTGLNRVTSDQIGMLATVMNGLLLRDSFNNMNIPSKVLSAVPISGFVETYDRHLAINYLEMGKVVIFVAGTGCPLFSTDSAASLRGIEIGADIILKATKVDGVYSSDPKIDSSAKLYHRLSYQEVIERQLEVMDAASICLCRENDMPLRVFNMFTPGLMKKIILGSKEGTLISN